MPLTPKAQLMNANDVQRALRRIAHEIVERNRGAERLALVGIHTRGVPIAEHLAELIAGFEGVTPPVGKLDITLYRDDLTEIALQPVVKKTEVPFDVQVEGDYLRLMSWLERVEGELHPMVVKRFRIEPLADAGLLRMELRVVSYRAPRMP